jgi:uncharacterized protein (TIGR03437 family)
VLHNSVADGAAPQQSTYAQAPPQLMVGCQSAQPNFSGLTPGFARLSQVNAVVLPGMQVGGASPPGMYFCIRVAHVPSEIFKST